MNKRFWPATCAALSLGLGVALAAQSPQTSTDSKSKTVTVTGCLTLAAETPTGTSGTAGSARTDQTKFLLTSVTAGTSGVAESAEPRAAASAYRLDADEAKLTSHVGQKVEVSGTIEMTAASPSQPPATASSSSSTAPKLKVDTVRMIAATCKE